MDMTQQPPANPGASQGAMPGQDTDTPDGGYTIEIEVAGDGSITVSCEDEKTEDAEQPGMDEGADEGNSVPAKTIEEALSIAKSIYANNGQMPPQDSSAGDLADAKQGYAKRALKPAGGLAAVFGD